jgi:hypothetical protein
LEANQHAACADHIFQVDCKLHVISEGTIVHIN